MRACLRDHAGRLRRRCQALIGHPCRQVQCLRLVEIDARQIAGLDAALESLEVGGRLVVISFHSLEDRIVKLFMRKLVKGESDNLPRNLPVRFEAFSPKIKVHGKAQFAGEAELKANPRSRSAVMRVAEKLR